MDNETLKSNLTSGEHWLRLLYMLLFAVVLYVAAIVVGLVIVVQFLFALISGKANDNLKQFGGSLSRYIFQVLRFMTYNREEKPFPFSDWPESDGSDELVSVKPEDTPS